MTTNIVICDDSSFARKQISRALPDNLDARITLTGNGHEALDAIRDGRGDVLFLDLNMPGIDGYEVLEIIREEHLEARVVVISGDIQPEAHERVMKLGAITFIEKPINAAQLSDVLSKYSLVPVSAEHSSRVDVKVDIWDCYKEVTNVAMGRAADLLARLLNTFIEMPVPNINMMERSELKMTLSDIGQGNSVFGVCQGFIGTGIAGEGLVIFSETSLADIADLLQYEGELDQTAENELLMDVACILIGSTLKGIAEQLDIIFSQGHPVILGRHVKVTDLLTEKTNHWDKTLALELGVKIENKKIKCDLLILFTKDSIKPLNERVALILD